MKVDLTEVDLEILIDSLEYSKRAIRDALDTPQKVRAENLARVEAVAGRLRTAKQVL